MSIEVFDETYPQDYLEGLREFYLSSNPEWKYLKDCAFGDMVDERGGDVSIPSFSSVPMGERKVKDEKSLKGWSLGIYLNQQLFGLDPMDLFRLRIGLQLPLLNTSHVRHHNPHTDYPDPHMTVLLYLCDTDGDTFFFDDDGDIIKRVTPKLGRAVVFNGQQMHSSSSPSFGTRLAANFNYFIDRKEQLDLPSL
jgi:hypothetical protein